MLSNWKIGSESFYLCNTCGKEFITVDFLHGHIHRMHPVLPAIRDPVSPIGANDHFPFVDDPRVPRIPPRIPRIPRGSHAQPVEMPPTEKGKEVTVWATTSREVPKTCTICKKSFLEAKSLYKHVKRQHAEAMPDGHNARGTGDKTRIKTSRKQSKPKKRVAAKPIKYKCRLCRGEFPDAVTLKMHNQLHDGDVGHGAKQNHCLWCEKSYTKRNCLTRHITKCHFDVDS